MNIGDHIYRIKWMALLTVWVVTMLPVARSYAYTLSITPDHKVTIRASDTPLQHILRDIAKTGIQVQIDPQINPLISVAIQDQDMESAVKRILKSLNYALIYQVDQNRTRPNGQPVLKVSKIQVFMPGKQESMISLDSVATEPAPPPVLETRIIIKKNKIFVPVTLGYDNAQVDTTLVLDTGADSTVIHQNVAHDLGITEGKPSLARGVGGIEIKTNIVRLNYLKVGPNIVKTPKILIIEYQGPYKKLYNGLLGNDFLKNFPYMIDTSKSVIKWQPN